MMRVSSLLITTAAAAIMLSGAAIAQDRVVNVFNWNDYIDEEILGEFTAETGIEVNYQVFDSNFTLQSQLLAGNTQYDVVFPTATFLANQIIAGVYQPLDKSLLDNLGNMDEGLMERLSVYDPGNTHAVVYMWGTTGIGMNPDKIREQLGDDADLSSWDLIFDPEIAAQLESCGIYHLDDPTEMIPAALNYLGMEPDLKDADSVAMAAEALNAVRPYVRKFHSSENISALANGDICIAVGWSGDMLQARDRAAEAGQGVTVDYVIPDEGALLWMDVMAIPASAPNAEEAHAFVNYLMRPEVIAKATNYVAYANGNAASTALLDPEIREDTAVYPNEETQARLYAVTPNDQRTERLFTRTWTQVTTGQ